MFNKKGRIKDIVREVIREELENETEKTGESLFGFNLFDDKRGMILKEIDYIVNEKFNMICEYLGVEHVEEKKVFKGLKKIKKVTTKKHGRK